MASEKVANLMDRLYRCQVDGTTEFYELIKTHLEANDFVLDLGCGFGKKETDLRRDSRVVVGCDLSQDVSRNQFVCERTQANAYDLPFKDGTFDAALMDYVLEHLRYPEKCAAELFRTLKPGGKLFFRTPNLYHYVALISNATPHSFHRWVLSWAGRTEGVDPFETYYQVNTLREVRRCFHDAGFIVEQIRLVEKEPSYLMFARPALLIGYCYERLVNSTSLLAQLRSNIFAFFRKPATSCGSARQVGRHRA
jgi:SAM-dependent methyltransferase